MIEQQRIFFPVRRRMAGSAALVELLPMRILVAAQTVRAHAFEQRGAQRGVCAGRLVALGAIHFPMLGFQFVG